jgi:hypothetical protein
MTTPAVHSALQRLGLVPWGIDTATACRLGSGCLADGDDDLCGSHRAAGVSFDSHGESRVHVTYTVAATVRAPVVVLPAYLTRAG